MQRKLAFFSENRYSWLFVLRFFLAYGLLSGLYFLYLSLYDNQADGLTVFTAQIAEKLIDAAGYDARILARPTSSTLDLHLNGQYLARIIEGCNGLSVLILFWAFLWAFSGPARLLGWFAFLGGCSILVVNWLRIAVLSVALYEYPQHAEFLHQLVFPALIYGWIVTLWLVWVFKFYPR